MTKLKVKKVCLDAVFNEADGKWIPKFAFENEQEARNWQLMEGDCPRVSPLGLVTNDEVEE